jgi:hypothetical protein
MLEHQTARASNTAAERDDRRSRQVPAMGNRNIVAALT